MTTTTTGTRNTWSDLLAGAGAQVRQARKTYLDWQTRRTRYHATLRELRSLGPRELADIGIAPGDIMCVARRELERS